jgi:hypothetical protein
MKIFLIFEGKLSFGNLGMLSDAIFIQAKFSCRNALAPWERLKQKRIVPFLFFLSLLLSLAAKNFASIMDHLHWQSLCVKTSAISHWDIVFLTCLGQGTEIDMILSVSRRPRW